MKIHTYFMDSVLHEGYMKFHMYLLDLMFVIIYSVHGNA